MLVYVVCVAHGWKESEYASIDVPCPRACTLIVNVNVPSILHSENCNPGWTAEPLKPHRFVLLPPKKGASALMDDKTQGVHD